MQFANTVDVQVLNFAVLDHLGGTVLATDQFSGSYDHVKDLTEIDLNWAGGNPGKLNVTWH